MENKAGFNTQISNTTLTDLNTIVWLFDEAIKLQNINGYRVWESIDITALQRDIENKLQFKIEYEKDILCVFSIQYNDPYIWQAKDQCDAIYLHRIVTNPNYKGQRLFEKVLNWVVQFAEQNERRFIRMDTWAENEQLIQYYKSFGFQFIENCKTSNTPELPLQNRNLNLALLELALN